MNGQPLSIIVFERDPRWVPELQRQFLDDPVRVIRSRSLKHLSELVAERLASVAVISLDADPAGTLHLLNRMANAAESLRTLVVGNPSFATLEWFIRELGAIEFLTEPVPAHHMADLCRRVLLNESSKQ